MNTRMMFARGVAGAAKKKVSVLTIAQILATMTVFYGDGTVPGRLEVCKTKRV